MNDINSPHFWQAIYREGRLGWDLGEPTPVFRRLLESGAYEPGRIIVLGAGRGYDARLFARAGFQVTAVDFAPTAVQVLREYNDPQAPVAVVHADIFNLPPLLRELFDYVLEYTCYCAIDPQRRREYADVVAGLLKPGGTYIALAFPTDGQDGGPPFTVSPEELIALLQKRAFTLQQRQTPPDSVPRRRGREELMILTKDEE